MEDTNTREKKKIKVLSNQSTKASSLFKFVLHQSYLRRVIFNHVSSIHKQLEIETVKVSSLYTLVDYIRYGLNDLFFKHIDQLWSLMFPDDGRYRNDHSLRLTRIISTAIDYHNDRVLEYLLNRIKSEIGPFQTTLIINYDHNGSLKVESKYIKCFSLKMCNLLIDDSVFIESKELLHRIAKSVILVIGNVDIIRNFFKRYNLSNLSNLFLYKEYQEKGGPPTIIKDLFNKKTDSELIELYKAVTNINREKQPGIYLNGYAHDRIYPPTWSFGDSLASGSEEVVSLGNVCDVFVESIHPVFCSSRYIDLFSKYLYVIRDNNSTNIIRSTLQQSPKGQEYKELDYVLKSKFCQSVNLDFADSVASILDLTGGDGDFNIDLIERLVAYANFFPSLCQFPMESVHRYTQDDYPHRDQFISVVSRVLEESGQPIFILGESDKWILHPTLIEKMIQLPRSCLDYEELYYFYLSSAAMTANMKLYKKISSVCTFDENTDMAYYLVKILSLVVNAGHYQFATEFINEYKEELKLISSEKLKWSIRTQFRLYFHLCKNQVLQDQQQDYLQLANQILNLVPTENQFEILYYASDLTDDQFNTLWKRFKKHSNVGKWLAGSSKQSKLLNYDQTFFNHIERMYKLHQQDQLDKYQYIKYPMNPPPLTRRYIGIWNQCLQNYYFNNKDNNNNNRIVKNYTQKEYENLMNLAIDIGFIPFHK
ncbi:hypothetical protein DFA_10305 [Cavenderia fasciculata]|uniref:Uncharacterized protein n=1 Tax=Cavenderia fasciculata TaxID=261658 RepID=F4Q9U7_CACFS|nr:uncharacterized protein DFA_10305 [Cavenderia fasciculata]EGG15466.1 hypothetical protein DFA_10305 [Cavenderia fasciculata]|eukprot:XP_004354208.1 hypothetical protein DFA_10305 [Cavenderia fasciculata]